MIYKKRFKRNSFLTRLNKKVTSRLKKNLSETKKFRGYKKLKRNDPSLYYGTQKLLRDERKQLIRTKRNINRLR